MNILELPTEDAQLSYTKLLIRLKKKKNTTTHWICRYYRQIKCSRLVITSRNEIVKKPKDHICNIKPRETEKRQAKNQLKEKTLTTVHHVQSILKTNPARIMMDFKKAAVDAFSATFLAEKDYGCYALL